MIKMGCNISGVTMKKYAPLAGGAPTLVKHHATGSMFGFVQDERYHTNWFKAHCVVA